VNRPRDGTQLLRTRSRRIHRSLVSIGTATFGPGIPPPKPGDPGVRVEWELLRHDDDGWRVVGSTFGPTWMPENITASVIWVSWVIFGLPRDARRSLDIGLRFLGNRTIAGAESQARRLARTRSRGR
jgi:hypothetical protein